MYRYAGAQHVQSCRTEGAVCPHRRSFRLSACCSSLAGCLNLVQNSKDYFIGTEKMSKMVSYILANA